MQTNKHGEWPCSCCFLSQPLGRLLSTGIPRRWATMKGLFAHLKMLTSWEGHMNKDETTRSWAKKGDQEVGRQR